LLFFSYSLILFSLLILYFLFNSNLFLVYYFLSIVGFFFSFKQTNLKKALGKDDYDSVVQNEK